MISLKKVARKLRNIYSPSLRKWFATEKNSDIIRLAYGETEFKMPNHLLPQVMNSFINDAQYLSPTQGLPELRQKLSEVLVKQTEIEYSKDEIAITVATSEALFCAVQTVINPRDEVILFDPFYTAQEPLVRLAGGRPIYVPTYEKDLWNPKIEEVEDRISRKTKAIILSSPNNPTGAVYSKKTLNELAELALRHDLYVISDEVMKDILYDGEKHFSISSFNGMKERTFVCGSFSRIHGMTGLRVGYVSTAKTLMDELMKVHLFCVVGVSTVSQRSALAILEGQQEHIPKYLSELDYRRKMAVSKINKIYGFSSHMPKGAYWLLPNVKKLLREKNKEIRAYLSRFGKVPISGSEQMQDYLLYAAKVAVGGNYFGYAGEGYIRIAYSNSREELSDALDRIGEAISNL